MEFETNESCLEMMKEFMTQGYYSKHLIRVCRGLHTHQLAKDELFILPNNDILYFLVDKLPTKEIARSIVDVNDLRTIWYEARYSYADGLDTFDELGYNHMSYIFSEFGNNLKKDVMDNFYYREKKEFTWSSIDKLLERIKFDKSKSISPYSCVKCPYYIDEKTLCNYSDEDPCKWYFDLDESVQKVFYDDLFEGVNSRSFIMRN